jgi:hypothetical protein
MTTSAPRPGAADGNGRRRRFFRQQAARWRDVVEQRGGDGDVGDVARRQDEGERFALRIGQSVDLAGAPAT